MKFDEFKEQKKEVEDIVSPIINKLYKDSGAGAGGDEKDGDAG